MYYIDTYTAPIASPYAQVSVPTAASTLTATLVPQHSYHRNQPSARYTQCIFTIYPNKFLNHMSTAVQRTVFLYRRPFYSTVIIRYFYNCIYSLSLELHEHSLLHLTIAVSIANLIFLTTVSNQARPSSSSLHTPDNC